MSTIQDHPSTMNPAADDASESGDSTGEVETTPAPTTTDPPNRYEKLERLKREKRLAMNRECARARRRRKKLRMELLESRVQELTQKNGRIAEANDSLRMRVAQLEAELNIATSSMTMGMPDPTAAMGAGANPFLGAGRMPGFPSAAGAGGATTPDSQALLAEKLSLQRRALAAGLGGADATTGLGLGGALNSGSSAAAPQMGAGNLDALRYMQLMKAKSAMREDPSAAATAGGAGAGGNGMQNAALFGGQFGSGARGMPGADY